MSDCDLSLPLRAKPVVSHTGSPPPHAHRLPTVHGHRILGRITRHSRRRVMIKSGSVPLDGCRKISAARLGDASTASAARIVASLKAIPAVASGIAVAGGSFVLGGFGGDGATLGAATCCQTGTIPVVVLSEPVSLALLATGAMLVVALHAALALRHKEAVLF